MATLEVGKAGMVGVKVEVGEQVFVELEHDGARQGWVGVGTGYIGTLTYLSIDVPKGHLFTDGKSLFVLAHNPGADALEFKDQGLRLELVQ